MLVITKGLCDDHTLYSRWHRQDAPKFKNAIQENNQLKIFTLKKFYKLTVSHNSQLGELYTISSKPDLMTLRRQEFKTTPNANLMV